jgi:thioredoxin 1
MKSYRLLSLSLLCSIGLTSCWSRHKNSTPVENTITRAETNLSASRVHYLSDYITREQSPENVFASLVQQGNVIIDFYADWCGPCKRLGAALQEVAPITPTVLIIKVDVETYATIAERYKVQSLPTMLFFRDGQQVHKMIGFNGKADLMRLINNLY